MTLAIHGSFTIERHYPYPPARVFRAWADPAAKAAWFAGPDEWQQVARTQDFRVGGEERLAGGPKGGPIHTFVARYHDIVQSRRIVYAYDMFVGETKMSVSVACVEFVAAEGGTRMVFTEHAVFLDGQDGTASRREGTEALLANLGAHLEREAEREVVSSRVFPYSREELFSAFADPNRLARWWGPRGFRNTFAVCDFRAGGEWRFTMHGPDGTDFPNHSVFEEVAPERIVIRHVSEERFTMTVTLDEEDGGTRLTWAMRFERAEVCRQIRGIVVPANEQNFDRLEAELRG